MSTLDHYLPFHPLTGLQAVGIVAGRPVWPILGGSEPPADPPNPPNPAPTPTPTPPTDPPAPPADPPEKKFSQAELDAIVADRLAREKRKTADYDDLKKKATDFDKLQRDQETEKEKAVREAREEGLAAGRAESRPHLVEAEFRAASAGRIDRDRLATLTEDIDMGRYVLQDGTVDVEKVAKKVDAWSPPASNEPPPPPGPKRPKPDPTQGAGRQTVSTGERGLAEAERRFGKKTPTS